MIEAAEAQGNGRACRATRYEGYVVWINALVASGGGGSLDESDRGRRRDARRSRRPPATAPPRSSAKLARSPAAPADLSTASEEEARATFQGERGASW